MLDTAQEIENNRPLTAAVEAWRMEVDQIIAAIHPRPELQDCEQTLAAAQTPEMGSEEPNRNAEVAPTQPALPSAEALGAPTTSTACPDPSEAATCPAHPIAVESLRAACLEQGEEQTVPSSSSSDDAGMALVRRVAEAATEVHEVLGPGLAEHAYQQALAHELALRGIRAQVDVPVSTSYKGRTVSEAFRAPLIVEDELLVDVRGVDHLEPHHEAHLRTYLVLSEASMALLVNFHEPDLTQGLRAVSES